MRAGVETTHWNLIAMQTIFSEAMEKLTPEDRDKALALLPFSRMPSIISFAIGVLICQIFDYRYLWISSVRAVCSCCVCCFAYEFGQCTATSPNNADTDHHPAEVHAPHLLQHHTNLQDHLVLHCSAFGIAVGELYWFTQVRYDKLERTTQWSRTDERAGRAASHEETQPSYRERIYDHTRLWSVLNVV
jgi:hypothetical protein